MHTHANHANSITPIVAEASRAMLDAGLRDVRNQGVLLNGVNADPHALLDLCFRLLDGAQIMPYYFYMCDMIPFSEHWRVSLADAQRLQHHIMGYLPGFATPRIVCDVPFVGKRWVHQNADYDTEHGISYWTKNYRTSIEADDVEALSRYYEYYDPIHTLPEAGQQWWEQHGRLDEAVAQGRRDGRGLAAYRRPPGLVGPPGVRSSFQRSPVSRGSLSLSARARPDNVRKSLTTSWGRAAEARFRTPITALSCPQVRRSCVYPQADEVRPTQHGRAMRRWRDGVPAAQAHLGPWRLHPPRSPDARLPRPRHLDAREVRRVGACAKRCVRHGR